MSALLLLVVAVSAFGSVAKTSFVRINEGESARFGLLFWGNNESLELWVKEAPSNWVAVIQPESFTLSADAGSEYVNLGNSNRIATKAEILVKPSAIDGSVIIGARSRKEANGISFYEEMYFNLTVDVAGAETPVPEPDKNVQDENASAVIATEEEKTEKNGGSNILLYAVIIVFIIGISVFIYRRE